MTNTCQLKRGFFHLRECGAPAVGFCGACGRAACQRHVASSRIPAGVAGDMLYCVECAARTPATYDDYDDTRNRVYDNQTYDSGASSTDFDSNDARSFDTQAAQTESDFGGGGDFGGAGAGGDFAGS